ncbi:MFS transporter [Alicyclobacillus kakegawensis]|uniref:MFS transporter n=1 Tax=Alicyclobacillus kakegawensis TaxID=392012 RepID=UPI000834BA27|nr:MFS transporter [Alicyclobacillus kakegawensis]
MRLMHGIVPHNHARTFMAVTCAVTAVTFSQGLMIPWMATLEAGHLTPLLNSLSTSDTYLGLLVAMVFVGRVARRMSLRRLVTWALVCGIVSIGMFVIVENAKWWLLFRFIFGLSLGSIHFATQSWIGLLTTPEHRGKQMAFYGLAAGIGFAIGPLFLGAGTLARWLPFVLAAATFALSLGMVIRLPKVALQHQPAARSLPIGIARVYRIALPALALPLVFGFMESALNGDLPLFAARIHVSFSVVSASLAAFVLGSLVLQLPLGHVSDRCGRRTVLTGCSAVGTVLFGVLPLTSGSNLVFVTLFFVVGAFLGTLFSLSLGYLGDLVQPANLPFANQLAVANLGFGLMVGPTIGGLAMKWLGPSGMFWAIAFLYLLYVAISVTWTAVNERHESADVSL